MQLSQLALITSLVTRCPSGQRERNQLITRSKKPSSSWSSTISMFVSLLIVIGLFFARRSCVSWTVTDPSEISSKEVVQVIWSLTIGTTPANVHDSFGGKLLLVSQQMGQTTTTLSEIENPDEVSHLLGLCEQQSSNSISNSFGCFATDYAWIDQKGTQSPGASLACFYLPN